MKRYDYINRVIRKYKSKSYLEIGVQDGICFNEIRCAHKVGVDPVPNVPVTHEVTSDEFFATNSELFDVVFIDGLHHCEQVYQDFYNASQIANHAICLHDVAPLSERFQTREPTAATWNGDVWKTVLFLKDRHGIVPDWIGKEDHCVAVYLNPKPFVITNIDLMLIEAYDYDRDFNRILTEFKFI